MKIIVATISLNNEYSNNISKQNFILHISDMQFLIMSNNTIRPILSIKNPFYIEYSNNQIIVLDNKKKIQYTVIIEKIYSEIEINDNLFENSTTNTLSRKEDSVKQNVINNFKSYFPKSKILQTEYKTDYWNIDILAINEHWIYQIIELKKRSTDLNTIDQVVKYWKYFEENDADSLLYVIWVKNNGKNKKYALDSNVIILEE